MINLTSVNASFPLLRTRSVVTHVTARRSMAFEWLLIQSIATIEQHPEYRDMSAEEFFSSIFGIKDTDIMIKPLIPGLMAAGAVKVNGYSDELKMTQLFMRDFELTESGRTMQTLGKLPGIKTNNSITAFYDPIGDNLWVTKCPYQNAGAEPKGVEMESVGENAEFPIVSLFNQLQELRDNEDERPDWMSENSDILDINDNETSVLWYNEKHTVNLDDDMQLSINGLEGKAAEKVLDTVAPTLLSERELPRLKFENPEEEIKRFALLSDDKNIELWLRDFKDKACFVDDSLNFDFLKKDGQLFENKNGFYVKVINNAGKFKCEAKKSSTSKAKRMFFLVSIPESLLPDGTFFVSDSRHYGAGRIPFTYKSSEYDADVIYELNYKDRKEPYSMSSLLCQVVEKHYKESCDVVFALYPVNRTEFERYLKKIVDEEPGIEEKIAKITELNTISNTLINEKYLKDKQIAHLLADSSTNIPDTDQAISVIEAYSDINNIRSNDALMRELIKSTVINTQSAASLDELYEMMEYIKELGKNLIAYLHNEGAAVHLYSDDIKRELIGRFDSEDIFAEIEEYTDVEKNLLEMRRQCDQLNDILPEISVFERISRETWMEVALSDKDNLKRMYRIFTNWQEELEKFSEVFGDIEILRDSNRAFSNAVSSFERLGEVLEKFYLDMSTYGKVFIADTCALLHFDSLIEYFGKLKSTMLIIPQTVLEELDGLKKDADAGETAQKIIKSINANRGEDFLNISESSSPELLPDGLEKALNDNKILSVALKFQVKNPTILTDDFNLSNKAASLGITSMTMEDYFKSIEEKKAAKEKNKK